MPSLRQQTAAKLQEFSNFLRDEYLNPNHFDGWPGLPIPSRKYDLPEQMPRAEREGADLFLLGCTVDMNEYTWRAWSGAKQFYEAVPVSGAQQLWHWIGGHSLEEWNERRPKLHRYNTRHAMIFSVARTLVDNYGGDPRNIWEDNEGAMVLEIFETSLRLGPQISRMTLGGLRDHKLVQMNRSPFKADRWVCQVMKALELSATERPTDVERAGDELFEDPWSVDGALWELGKDYEIQGLAGFANVYKEMNSWGRIRSRVQASVRALLNDLSSSLVGSERWALKFDPTNHWAGIYLVKNNGALPEDMEGIGECKVWAWVGVGFYKKLVIAVDVAGNPGLISSAVARFCRDEANMDEVRQTSSGRLGMREFYDDRQVEEDELLNTDWLLRNLSAELKRLQRFINEVENNMAT